MKTMKSEMYGQLRERYGDTTFNKVFTFVESSIYAAMFTLFVVIATAAGFCALPVIINARF